MPDDTTSPESRPDETDHLERVEHPNTTGKNSAALRSAHFPALDKTNKANQKKAQRISTEPVMKIRRAARRTSQAYLDDLTNKRDAYADAKNGQAVRSYVKVNTGTQAGDDAERLKRNRDACSEYQANLSDEKRFKAQQRNWANKQRKKGWTEQQISDVLAERQAAFELDGCPQKVTYGGNF